MVLVIPSSCLLPTYSDRSTCHTQTCRFPRALGAFTENETRGKKNHTRNSPADFLSLLLCQSVFQKLFPHLFTEVDEPVRRLTFGPSFASRAVKWVDYWLTVYRFVTVSCQFTIEYLFFNTVPPTLSVILLWIWVCTVVFLTVVISTVVLQYSSKNK